MNREQRAAVARETMEILQGGTYTGRGGQAVSVGAALASACANTRLYRPEEYDDIMRQVAERTPAGDTVITVRSATTLEAARSLVGSYDHVACLNFASARNPGGGFLSGSQAQEESLARATGLYATLETQPVFYDHHRRLSTCLYSDHMIFSPRVPVFRDDHDHLLDEPWEVSMITSPAVNAGAVRSNEPENVPAILPTLARRARMLLGVLALNGCDAVVLGAWGCGVFRNDPAAVARVFSDALREPALAGRFRHAEFAIYDTQRDTPVLNAFEEEFG